MLLPELDNRKIKGTNPTFKEPTSGETDKWIVSTQWNKGYINISRQLAVQSPQPRLEGSRGGGAFHGQSREGEGTEKSTW